MLHNEARKLVLEAWDKTHNAREIAKYFSVNESTVYRLIEERARTGSYETRTQLRGRKTILTEKQHHDILELVQEQPDITMKEIVETLHLPVGDETVRRFLIKQGYIYKKKSLHAKEQDRPRCAEKTQSMDRNYIWCKCRTSNISRYKPHKTLCTCSTWKTCHGCYLDQHACRNNCFVIHPA